MDMWVKRRFKELVPGDRFIVFPVSGDNEGHGGYLGKHHIFVKLSDEYTPRGLDNARRECDGFWSQFSDDAFVLEVG